MIIEFTESNNGYGCTCCSQTFDDHNWISEKDALTIEQMYVEAMNATIDNIISKRYEKEGEILYGYRGDIIHRRGLKVFFQIGNEKECLIRNDQTTDVKIYTKEEILEMYNKEMKDLDEHNSVW